MRIIIIGAGEVGYNIADILSKEGNDVVIIDKNEEQLKMVSENLDVQTIPGSGSSPHVLKMADLDRSDMVVAVTDSDETNMVACLLAATQSKVPLKISRIRNPELNENSVLFDKNHLNIDLCINPEREAVKNAVNLMEFPGASEIIDFAGGRIKLVGFNIDPDCIAVGKKLSELREMSGGAKVLIVSITRGEKMIVPTGDSVIEANDYLFAVAESSEVGYVLEFFEKDIDPPKRVIIMGGGITGLILSEQFEKKGISTKIIEKRQDRCEMLASNLNKTVVLHGDGTSEELLKEENIQDTDYFIAVTSDEEANILGALVAKQLGARKAISLINRADYVHLISTVGIDGVINPRHAAIGKILHYIRKGKIVSATPLYDEKAEIFEVVALETSEITNKPFKDIKFPKGTIVGAIMRGDEVIIPGGDSVVLPGDHVVIFTLRSAISQVEKILTVKLDYF
ncbi:MAG: Trk system potassium transporter TrkA [Proteobacteria bacterium]|nr:Trk system potassium transporter TrkA [Pseudomonadota bacterium]